MAWCFEDESTVLSNSILDKVAHAGATVPSLWSLEVSNVLLVAERRGRITRPQSEEFLTLLQALPIECDLLTGQRCFQHAMGLARQFQLSAYDATYLELAQRLGLGLATFDTRLGDAARNLGISVVD